MLSDLLKSALINSVMRDLISEIIHNMITMQLALRSADSSKIKIEIVIQMIQAVTETESKSVTEDENYKQTKNEVLTTMMQSQNAMMQNQNKLLKSLMTRLESLTISHEWNDENRLQDREARSQNQ